MKSNNKKRAFTIVELVIVIAVIAILAAVLIPTFSNLIKKSHESVDRQLVYHINQALAIHEAENGKPKTAAEAIEATAELGFTVSKLTPTTDGYDIVWDSLANRYALLNSNGNVVYQDEDMPFTAGSTAWKLYADMPSVQQQKADGFSVYLKGREKTGTVEVVTGFDAGHNTGIAKVNYSGGDRAKDVVICTCSYDTVLTIDAENDTVRHYNKAGSVNVTAVAMTSYHEYGDVLGNIKLVKGNVVVEAGCKAAAVVIDLTAEEVASTTAISADNTKATHVPIVLNTSKGAWAANEHRVLIDPTKNNIIYTVPDSDAQIVKEQGQEATLTDVVAYAKNAKKYYTSIDTAINGAMQNEYIMLLKDGEVYHAKTTQVNPIQNGVTIDLNGHLLKVQKDSWITGKNLTIKNGSLSGEGANQSYCIFFGDEAETSVELSNLTCVGGLNFYNTTATINACNVRLNDLQGYNAIWADSASDITVQSGTFDASNRQNGRGVVGCSDSVITINDGTFLSNDVNLLVSSSEYQVGEYATETNGIFINGGRFNVNVSDFTFLIIKNGTIIEQRQHVNLIRQGYTCYKYGDLWFVVQK